MQTSCRMCPGGAGSTTAGSAVCQGWRSVRTTPCRAVPGTARLALVRRRVCSRAATVGAALLPPWTCTRAVTRWMASWAATAAAAARWASWTVQPTSTTHRRAPSWEGYFHSAGCRPGAIWAMPHSRILSRDSPWKRRSGCTAVVEGRAQRAAAVGCTGGSVAEARAAAATTRTAPGREPCAADRVADA